MPLQNDPEINQTCCCLDLQTCAECNGHNRCEYEEAAGFGDYGRDDPREDR